MASLLAKDTYLQSLARKICAQPSPEPQKRTSGKEQPRAGTGRASRGGAPPPPALASLFPAAAMVGVYPTPHLLQVEWTGGCVQQACETSGGNIARDA